MTTFNVRDFGAKGDGVTNDTAAIQAAVNSAIGAGGGSVYIPTGTYIVSGGQEASDGAIMLGNNVTVYGDGMGATSVKLQDNWNKPVTGIFRDPYGIQNHDITVRDLTIDGNRAHNIGKIDGWFNGVAPGKPGTDTNITLDHVEIMNCGGYGFDPHEQTTNLTISNSVSHGNGLDGFTLDYQIHATIANNVAYDNDRHGFNIPTTTQDSQFVDNIAYGNGSDGLIVQRGSENIPSPHDITISGGHYYDNVGNGIEVNKADAVTIDGVLIDNNGQRGIRLYGSANSIIENSTIHDNSQSKNGGYEEVRIESYDDTKGVSGHVYATTGTQITNNNIYETSATHSSYGIREGNDTYTDYTTGSGNTVTGGLYGGEKLYGAHSTVDGFTSGSTGGTTVIGGAQIVDGTAGPETLSGGAGNDAIRGFGGDDKLYGGAGSDTLDGGAGRDTLYGGDGHDLFRFSAIGDSTTTGNAYDRIADFSVTDDRIDLTGLGFTTLVDATKTHSGELRLAYSASTDRTYVRTDQSSFQFYLDGDFRGKLTNTSFVFTAPPADPVNHAPVENGTLSDRTAAEDSPFSFTISPNAFTDPDGDAIGYVIHTAGSETLPSWLSFDPDTNTLSGTPGAADVGTVSLVATATDSNGASTDSNAFALAVSHTNHAPIVAQPLADQATTQGSAFSYTFAPGSFTDPDSGDTLTYTAVQNGQSTLPAWLTFNAATHVFSGTPNAAGSFAIDVTASDGHNGSVTDEFVINAASATGTPITGDAGNNKLTGTELSETIQGLAGNDTIVGNGGNDTIDGGAGKDVLTGGAGNDVFRFSALADSNSAGSSVYDRITDFTEGQDKVDVHGLGFASLVTSTTKTASATVLRDYYDATNDRTYVTNDQTHFLFHMDHNHTTTLHADSFLF